MAGIEIGRYKETAQKSIHDQTLQEALSCMQQRIGRATAQKYKDQPEGQDLRQLAKDLRHRDPARGRRACPPRRARRCIGSRPRSGTIR